MGGGACKRNIKLEVLRVAFVHNIIAKRSTNAGCNSVLRLISGTHYLWAIKKSGKLCGSLIREEKKQEQCYKARRDGRLGWLSKPGTVKILSIVQGGFGCKILSVKKIDVFECVNQTGNYIFVPHF